jgi:hypothetical protein
MEVTDSSIRSDGDVCHGQAMRLDTFSIRFARLTANSTAGASRGEVTAT